MVIPPEILHNAQGLAIITQLKAGFLFSGRAGSGVIVARLPDGSWSAPSALVTAGAGVGGQIGAELTDFVFILNNQAAVDTFSHAGSITLGGNVSVAAGPLGRNAEVAGSASRSSVAAIFSYSKTKGLFAGVSLEGSVLVERREANRKFYGPSCTAKQILSGRVDPPPETDVLFRVLESRAFRSPRANYDDDDFYDDIPDDFSDSGSVNSRGPSRRNTYGGRTSEYDDYDDYDEGRRGGGSGGDRFSSPRRATTSNSGASWEDDYYDRPASSNLGRRGTTSSRVRSNSTRSSRGYDDDGGDGGYDDYGSGGRGGGTSVSSGPGRPKAPKPQWRDETGGGRRGGGGGNSRYDEYEEEEDYGYGGNRRGSSGRTNSNYGQQPKPQQQQRGGNGRGSRGEISNAPEIYDEERRQEKARERERQREAGQAGEKAVALFTFSGEQGGDLDFRKGDIITIVKRSESRDDWWTGRRGDTEGIFPANYVELV